MDAFWSKSWINCCLLYTSDAADDLTRVDLGGRRIIKKMGEESLKHEMSSISDLLLLTEDNERALLVLLSRYPEIVELASVNRAPQNIVHYLRGLSADFHSYYNAHKMLVDDEKLRNARISLALGIRQVLYNGLSLLGVNAPDRM